MSAESGGNANGSAGDEAGGSPFGRRPDERVYAPGRYPRRPDVRTRVAPMARPGGLDFEPEVDGQKEALAAAFAPAPAPRPTLAFEPEEGGALDRLAGRPAARGAPPAADDIASLLALAAGKESGGDARARGPAAQGPPASAALPVMPPVVPPLDPAAGQAAFRGRRGVSGDIEAELFGPGSARLAARPATAPHAEALPPAPAPAAAPPSAPAGPVDEPPPTRSVASVFLSERVLGKRRRRKTANLLRRSAQFRAVADRWLGRIYRRTARVLRAVDRVTGMARLPLANIFWSAAIAGLSLLLGLALPLAGGIFAACLILTVAGQPARNLVGIAGIMILSASLAEVARQRERFLEIFLDLFG